jgi:hypothetical protein
MLAERFFLRAVVSLLVAMAFVPTTASAQVPEPTVRKLESVPALIDERRRIKRNKVLDALKTLPGNAPIHPYMVIVESVKWKPGRTITVAFLGGNADLHRNIEQVASEWSAHANITFDFGRDPTSGNYRAWSAKDKDYKADIRISFHQEGDLKGYWSVVGIESRDRDIVKPNEASMNLEGFDQGTPADWQAIVRHEFGHAIGLEHEHQHPQGGCDWRWADDPGYKPTRNKDKQFIRDASGKYPGIYTVLGGPPNNWKTEVVDRNIKQLPNASAYRFGPFDKLSIMKYQFDEWMFLKGTQSPCYSTANDEFSAEDKKRIAEFYPKNPVIAQTSNENWLNQVIAITPYVATSPVLRSQLQRIEGELTR